MGIPMKWSQLSGKRLNKNLKAKASPAGNAFAFFRLP